MIAPNPVGVKPLGLEDGDSVANGRRGLRLPFLSRSACDRLPALSHGEHSCHQPYL
jgi:hypothetical protein